MEQYPTAIIQLPDSPLLTEAADCCMIDMINHTNHICIDVIR